jgi:hypothetical protein
VLLSLVAARVLESGHYDMDAVVAGEKIVERYPWVLLLVRADELEGALGRPIPFVSSEPQVRLSVDRESADAFDGVPFGTLITALVDLTTEQKVISGTNRTMQRLKGRIVEWRPVGAAVGPSGQVGEPAGDVGFDQVAEVG